MSKRPSSAFEFVAAKQCYMLKGDHALFSDECLGEPSWKLGMQASCLLIGTLECLYIDLTAAK